MALFGVLRRSELVALLWSDIDFEQMTVNITKSTCVANGKPITKPPKNKTSERVVSLPGHIMTMLEEYRTEYLKYKQSIGSKWQQSADNAEYLFISWNGTQIYPATPYRVFKRILQAYNTEHEEKLPLITLHGLRHTSATLLIGENIDIKTVSIRLGHAQTSTTMNIYSHALQKLDRKAADALENLLQKH